VTGQFNFTIQYQGVPSAIVFNQLINAYVYQANFALYGTFADTFVATNSTSQCANNIPLGFTFIYMSTPFTSVSVCQQAYISLGSSNYDRFKIAATNTTGLATNSSWGTVTYLAVNDSSSLASLTGIINTFYFKSSVVNFTVTGAFMASWNHVPFSSNQSLECNAQIFLATDGYFSFFIMIFGKIDRYSTSFYGNLTNNLVTPFTGNLASSNVGLTGTYIYLVNGQGTVFIVFYNYKEPLKSLFDAAVLRRKLHI
jgi:hypothetical protein